MKAVFLTACLFGTQVFANADLPSPLVGYWSDTLAYCKNAGGVGEETPVEYSNAGIFGLEFSCEFTSITEIGIGQSWAVKTKCLDAGFEDRYEEIYMITDKDRLLIISAYGEVTDLLRCDKTPE